MVRCCGFFVINLGFSRLKVKSTIDMAECRQKGGEEKLKK
jgi:hypothetical protein